MMGAKAGIRGRNGTPRVGAVPGLALFDDHPVTCILGVVRQVMPASRGRQPPEMKETPEGQTSEVSETGRACCFFIGNTDDGDQTSSVLLLLRWSWDHAPNACRDEDILLQGRCVCEHATGRCYVRF